MWMYAIKSTLPFLLSQQDDFGLMLDLVSTLLIAWLWYPCQEHLITGIFMDFSAKPICMLSVACDVRIRIITMLGSSERSGHIRWDQINFMQSI